MLPTEEKTSMNVVEDAPMDHDKTQEMLMMEKLHSEMMVLKCELENMRLENYVLYQERRELQDHVRKLMASKAPQPESGHIQTGKEESSWQKKRRAQQAKVITDLKATNSKLEKQTVMQQRLICSMEKKLIQMIGDQGSTHSPSRKKLKKTVDEKKRKGLLYAPLPPRFHEHQPADDGKNGNAPVMNQADYLQAVMDKQQRMKRKQEEQQQKHKQRLSMILQGGNVRKRSSSVDFSLTSWSSYLKGTVSSNDDTSSDNSSTQRSTSDDVDDEHTFDFTVKSNGSGQSDIFVIDYDDYDGDIVNDFPEANESNILDVIQLL